MPAPVQYPYSVRFSIAAIVLMALLMLLLLSNVISANNTLGWTIYGVFILFFLIMVALLITQRLIPAIKGNTALQLDDEGISDYIRDVSINWEDIEEINLIQGRSASTMAVSLKFESERGSLIMIHLRWVKGKDNDIYDTTMAYFEQATQDGLVD